MGRLIIIPMGFIYFQHYYYKELSVDKHVVNMGEIPS